MSLDPLKRLLGLRPTLDPPARGARPSARRAAPVPDFPPAVDLPGLGAVPLAVSRNPRARRMILRLAKDGAGIRVTAPPSASPRMVTAFVVRHEAWIAERMTRAAPALAIRPGAVIPFRGTPLRLVHAPGLRGHRFEAGEGGAVLLVGGEPEHFARRVRDVLKREARADLEAAVARHAPGTGLKPAAMSLKDTVSRWGSCTADRRLAFSWRIVMAPPEVLDYLAAHEVAHFRHMDHGADFWALCRRLCPGTPAARDWLKARGHELHAIRFE